MVLAAFSSQVMALEPGDPAVNFSLRDIGTGQMLGLEDFPSKVIYVDFWASWCTPCRKSLPLYESMSQRLPQADFSVVAINLDEEPEDARKFLNSHPVSYTVLLNPDGNVAERWQVKAMPSSFLLDSNRRIVKTWAGFRPSHLEEIEREIQSALAQ